MKTIIAAIALLIMTPNAIASSTGSKCDVRPDSPGCGSAYAAETCPFDLSDVRYMEVAVPCTASGQPDFSKAAIVNQADASGGACQVKTNAGEHFSVSGSELLIWNRAGQVHVGTLLVSPSCYQTDNSGEYYPVWVPIQI